MTRGSRWMSCGTPSAIFSPKSSTAMRSHRFMTSPMSCSINTIVSPMSRMSRTRLTRPCFSDEILALQAYRATRGFEHAGDAVEDRRLARAVGPDDPEDLPVRHLQGNAVERLDAAELHRELVQLEQHPSASRHRFRRYRPVFV